MSLDWLDALYLLPDQSEITIGWVGHTIKPRVDPTGTHYWLWTPISYSDGETSVSYFCGFPFVGHVTTMCWEGMQRLRTCQWGHFPPSLSFHVQPDTRLYVMQISVAIDSNFWLLGFGCKPVCMLCIGVALAGADGAGWIVSNNIIQNGRPRII